MQCIRYLHTFRSVCAVLLLSAVAVSHDAFCSWRSFFGVGAAVAAGSVAAMAERTECYARVKPIVTNMFPCATHDAFKEVNAFVAKVCNARGISAAVYYTHESFLQDGMCTLDAREPVFKKLIERYCPSASKDQYIIVISHNVAQQAEKMLKSKSLDEWFDIACGKKQQEASAAQSLSAMAVFNEVPFMQAFTAMLHHEITHIERNHGSKTLYVAAISPFIGAVSYYALSRMQHACIPSQSWISYAACVPKLMVSTLLSSILSRFYMRNAEHEADDGVPFACPAYAQVYEQRAESEKSWPFWRRMCARLFSVHPLHVDRVNRIQKRVQTSKESK